MEILFTIKNYYGELRINLKSKREILYRVAIYDTPIYLTCGRLRETPRQFSFWFENVHHFDFLQNLMFSGVGANLLSFKQLSTHPGCVDFPPFKRGVHIL